MWRGRRSNKNKKTDLKSGIYLIPVSSTSGQFDDDNKKQQHPVGMLLLFKYKLLKRFFGLLGKSEFVKSSVFFARPCSYRKFQHLYHIYILGVEFPMCFFGVMVHNSLQPIDFFAVI